MRQVSDFGDDSPRRLRRAVVLWTAAVAFALGSHPGPVWGATIPGGPVAPVVSHIDVFSIEPVPPWHAGDPITEMPSFGDRSGSEASGGSAGLSDPLVAVQQAAPQHRDRSFTTPIVSVDGLGFTGIWPPAPVGDVGFNDYIQAVNGPSGSVVQIYDKAGNTVGSSFYLDTLGASDCSEGFGSPMVLFDRHADRWLLAESSALAPTLCLYVSATPDPTEGTWYAYAFSTLDYPVLAKIGVWSDAYYASTFESPDVGDPVAAVYALDRDSMIIGGAAGAPQRFAMGYLDGYTALQNVMPADLDGAQPPPDGSPEYFVRHVDDEAHSGYADDPVSDRLEIYAFTVDWNAPGNSTLTQLPDVTITDFNSWFAGYATLDAVPQPGSTTRMDSLREVIFHRLVYRNFGDHETLAGVFPTNIDPATSGTTVNAGLRWFELRKIGVGDWTLYQEGTYQPGDTSENRFIGAMAMDQSGDIALGYLFTDLDPAEYPSLKFTGRLSGDPLDTMGQAETDLALGTGPSPSNRSGEYAAMSVDPADDCTFWFTGEYIAGQWATRIGAFRFDACGPPEPPLFADDFEDGTADAWSNVVP